MSAVDVTVQIDIAAAPATVAALMFDPHRGPEWMQAITAVEAQGAVLEPGARARVSGQFMGRPVEWTSEVLAVDMPHRLTLKVEAGPFVGTVLYEIEGAVSGSRVTIRNLGETTVMAFLPSSVVEGPLRSILTADLTRLKELLERS